MIYYYDTNPFDVGFTQNGWGRLSAVEYQRMDMSTVRIVSSQPHSGLASDGGSAGRVLGPIEARLTTIAGLLLCAASVLFAIFPRTLVYSVVAFCAWGGVVLLYKASVAAKEEQRTGIDEKRGLRG